MSSKVVTLVVLLVFSEAVGLALGEWFFRLYLKAVPPVALSEFTSQSSHVAHLLYGAGVGVVLFVWALLGMAAARILQAMKRDKI